MNKQTEFKLKQKTIELMKQDPKPDEETVRRILSQSIGFIDWATCDFIETLAFHSQFNKISNIERL